MSPGYLAASRPFLVVSGTQPSQAQQLMLKATLCYAHTYICIYASIYIYTYIDIYLYIYMLS